MKVVKFKAWDKYNQVMLLVTGIDFALGLVASTVEKSGDKRIHKIADVELLQFIGRSDKKGIGIYAGDIIDDQFNCGQLVRIYYSEKLACFMGDCLTHRLMGQKVYYQAKLSTSIETYTKGRVVGNIYQNPELIKDAK